MNLSSKSLHDGIWDETISNTAFGDNRSPELSWTPVEGAAGYAVYMIDPDGHNWLHWAAYTTETELPEGADVGFYLGPYPPAGTHRYEVTVLALAEKPESLPGNFDGPDNSLADIRKGLGTILAEETLSGTYTKK